MSDKHHDSHQAGTEAYAALRTKALESLLVEKGLITTDVIDTVVRAYEQDIGPLNGAKVVARAWVDPAYKQRLLADGTSAIAELGFGGVRGRHGRAGEHANGAQCGGVHPVLLLSLARAGTPALLV